MAKFEFRLPDIGEGVTEGEIVAWHASVGDSMKEDQAMVEVMTDKATVTIGAPKTGTITERFGAVGEVVPVGKLLVVLEVDGVVAVPKADAPKSVPPPASSYQSVAPTPVVLDAPDEVRANQPPRLEQSRVDQRQAPLPSNLPSPAVRNGGPAATAVGDIREQLPGGSFFSSVNRADQMTPREPIPLSAGLPQADLFPSPSDAHQRLQDAQDFAAIINEHPLATPAVRKLARELNIDLRTVPPTEGTKVRAEDVRRAASLRAMGSPETRELPVHLAAEVLAYAAKANGAAAAPEPVKDPGKQTSSLLPIGRAPIAIAKPQQNGDLEERRPFVGVRRKIAERMQASKNTAAHFTFVEECDVTQLKDLRARFKGAAEKQGIKLTYLPFIAKAVVAALKKHPILNSALDETTNELVIRKYINLGIAASTDQGLMVPVVKNADHLSILEVAREIDRLGTGAKNGSLSPGDLTGSTFTITSLGTQGGLFATPILNFPEVGILGVHRIKERPVVKDGRIVIGEVMLLSLAFDHRIIDGHVGAAFAYDVIGYLENPDKLFLEMS